MPFFPAVGFIDDELFPTPEAVAREYRRRYSLSAYHRKRQELVKQISPDSTCELCPRVFRRVVPLTLVWRDTKAEIRGRSVGIQRANQLATASRQIRSIVIDESLIQALCSHHARQKLWKTGSVTHGTHWSAYKIRCRCDECEEYKADYALRRREDRRRAAGEVF